MSVLKEIARQLHCTEISGERIATEESGITDEGLYVFYEKQGFEQTEGSQKIIFRTGKSGEDPVKARHAFDRYETIGALKKGYAIYRNLLSAGFPEADAARLTEMSEADLQQAKLLLETGDGEIPESPSGNGDTQPQQKTKIEK